MKIIDHYIITKGGKPCRLGFREIHAKGLAVITTGEPWRVAVGVSQDSGKRQTETAKKRALNVINRTNSAARKLRDSVVFDWPKIQPLVSAGALVVTPVYVPKA